MSIHGALSTSSQEAQDPGKRFRTYLSVGSEVLPIEELRLIERAESLRRLPDIKGIYPSLTHCIWPWQAIRPKFYWYLLIERAGPL